MIYFRNMTREDIPSGLLLCRHAKWNQSSDDWKVFLELNPHGCRIALDATGDVVGTVATLPYEDHFSWIGMLLVHPKRQRQGIGTQLLMEALQLLRNHDTVKLDATPSGRQVYLKLNFVDEYKIDRMHRPANSAQELYSTSAHAMQEKDFPGVLRLDSEVFGADRRRVLERNFRRAPQYAFVTGAHGQIKGFCLGRPGYNFDHIGPLVAQQFDDASQLLLGALNQARGKAIIVDALNHTPAWIELLNSLGFVVMRPFIRMYRGSNSYPGVPEHQFAIAGPEFG